MQLNIGPFPSVGGLEWIAQARLLTKILRKGAVLPFAVPPEVLDEFERYYADWSEAAADEQQPFRWQRDVELGTVRSLLTYWFNLTQMLVDRPEFQPPGSDEARVFYRNLVAAILAAVADVDPEAAVLRDRWPQL